MAKAGDNIARWVLLAEYFQQLLDGGLSPISAELRIHREFLHCERPYRYRWANENGEFRQGGLPDSFWSNAEFNLPKSLVTGLIPPDPTAAIMADAIRRNRDIERTVRRMLYPSTDGDDAGDASIPRQDVRTIIVEVLITATRSVADVAAEPRVAAPIPDAATEADPAVTAAEPAALKKLTEAKKDKEIARQEIKKVYEQHEHDGTKPPNINELPESVKPGLAARGYKATSVYIKAIGEEPEFMRRRLEPGKHWQSKK